MTHSYSKILYEPEIDTLIDLDKSELPVVASKGTLNLIFGIDDGIRVIKSLRKRSYPRIRNAKAPMESAAYDRSLCAVERFSDVQIIIQVL